MKKIVFLQGPPRCGKDTIGEMIQARLYEDKSSTELLKFAQPINSWMMETFGVDCNDGHDKEKPCSELGGMSRRSTAIWYSEEVMKPRFGKDVFGNLMVSKLNKVSRVGFEYAVITDSGFEIEAIPVIEEFGKDRCTIIKVHREGRDFTNDSRNYWSHDGITCINFENGYHSLEDLSNAVSEHLYPEIIQPDWL